MVHHPQPQPLHDGRHMRQAVGVARRFTSLGQRRLVLGHSDLGLQQHFRPVDGRPVDQLQRLAQVLRLQRQLHAQQAHQAQRLGVRAHAMAQAEPQGSGLGGVLQLERGQHGLVAHAHLARCQRRPWRHRLGFTHPVVQLIRTRVGQVARARRHQGLGQVGRGIRGDRVLGRLGHAQLHVGNALAGQRVVAQVGELAAVVQA